MKMDKSFVSIVMPIFNRASRVGTSIDSVLSQTFTSYELIIVDDFSDDFDELSNLVDSYESEHIKLLRLPNKGNGAIARNYGVQHSKGDVICFIDSDDQWLPDKLEKQIQYLEQDVVITSLSKIQTIKNGRKLYTKIINEELPISGEVEIVDDPILELFGGLTSKLVFQTSTLMMSKELFQKSGGFDPDLLRHQDYQLLVCLKSAKAKFRKINTYTNIYVKDSQDSIKNKGWTIERSKAFLRKYLKSYKNDVQANFIVVQLFGPSLKTHSFLKWLCLIFELRLNPIKVCCKATVFLYKRLR